MIKYKLTCKDCDLKFDSWFSSSKEFDKLKKINLINCIRCNSSKVKKTLLRATTLLAHTQPSFLNFPEFPENNKILIFKEIFRLYLYREIQV